MRRVRPLRVLSRPGDETGAALVEFAIVLPVFLMLVLGMMTGGLAYSRKLSIAQATREGARYGATLPVTAVLPIDDWLTNVASLTMASSEGELRADRPGMIVCVAYVPGSGSPRRRQQVGSAVIFSNSTCITNDGRAGDTRVQILAQRSSKLEALVFSRDLNLASHAVARFEAQ